MVPARRRTILQVGAPIVAVATMMLGLRVGAKNAVRYATVYGAPIGRSVGNHPHLAWQITTTLDDRGVRETIPMTGLTVVARANGREAVWQGSSNEDGIAEMNVDLDGLKAGDRLELEVRAAGEAEPLAEGLARWETVVWGASTSETGERRRDEGRDETRDGFEAGVRPTRRAGDVAIDVIVESQRLIPGFPSSVWVHARSSATDKKRDETTARTQVEAMPEPGLQVERTETSTCANGWAEIVAIPQAHVVGAGFTARTSDVPPKVGEWFGALPVAPGAFFPSIPRVVDDAKPTTAVLVAPNPRKLVYAEVDDDVGRVFAAVLPVTTTDDDHVPRARFALPPLASGLHWLVVSGEPRGAERLGGATIAKPILVGEVDGVDVNEACSVGPWLARRPARGFPRWVALDGRLSGTHAQRGRHRLGLVIAGVSLVAAGLLEVLLLMASARDARLAMARVTALEEDADAGDAGDVGVDRMTTKAPGGSLAIAILVALLGFGLLAALLVAKA